MSLSVTKITCLVFAQESQRIHRLLSIICCSSRTFFIFFLRFPAPRSRGGGSTDLTILWYGPNGAGLLLCYSLAPVKSQRWQHILIQAASPLLMPLMVSHPFPHFQTFLPVLQAPSSLRPNFGRFVGPRDGATATYQGGGNSDIILDSAKWNSGTPDSRTSFRGVENGGRICPAPGVEPVTIRMGSGYHRF
jgi:hypothetical protein